MQPFLKAVFSTAKNTFLNLITKSQKFTLVLEIIRKDNMIVKGIW